MSASICDGSERTIETVIEGDTRLRCNDTSNGHGTGNTNNTTGTNINATPTLMF